MDFLSSIAMSKNTERTFFRDSIEQLESYFDDRLKDKEFLQLLYEELEYRTTQRAKKLRERVEKPYNQRMRSLKTTTCL